MAALRCLNRQKLLPPEPMLARFAERHLPKSGLCWELKRMKTACWLHVQKDCDSAITPGLRKQNDTETVQQELLNLKSH